MWHLSNSKRNFSAYRDIALMDTWVPLNLKEIAQSDPISNKRQVVFSRILHSNALLFEQGRKVLTESCRKFLALTQIRKKILNLEKSKYLLTNGSVGWDESVKWYFQSISGILGTLSIEVCSEGKADSTHACECSWTGKPAGSAFREAGSSR